MELVKKELQFFLDKKVPQVNFLDRTLTAITGTRRKYGVIFRNTITA